MCGIFLLLGKDKPKDELYKYFNKIQHRGPTNSQLIDLNIFENFSVTLGFHRLTINGVNNFSNQPLLKNEVYLICNGEIYNYKKINTKYGFIPKTQSDVEVILDLYIYGGIDLVMKEIDGEFAFAIYDTRNNECFVARDHLGIRGLYQGLYKESRYFASEAKALTFCDKVEQFPPRNYWSFSTNQFTRYYNFFDNYLIPNKDEIDTQLLKIKQNLIEAVEERYLTSDVEVGALLSGGLDSSLISSIASKIANQKGRRLKTFSIGMKGSLDLKYAEMVANFIGSEHHSVEVSEKDFLKEIENTIYTLGTYDVTTIRASVGHRLITKWVSENTNVKVLFTGETADELGSYLYFRNAPSNEDFQNESLRLLKDIHYFDGLRGDRSVSNFGIEARVPFASKKIIEYYLSISPERRQFGPGKLFSIEKFLIRKAFDDNTFLPKEVLWRKKDGFSDSVSSSHKPWCQVIKDHIDTIISNDEYQSLRYTYIGLDLDTKEKYYYRKIYQKHYGKFLGLTPYYWMPKWTNEKDPSGRKLASWQENNTDNENHGRVEQLNL